MKIRAFQNSDAAGLATVIFRSLVEVNSKDYSDREIQEKVREYTPGRIKKLGEKKQIFVADDNGRQVGVAMLRGDEISCVFVAPDRTGEGIGRLLMTAVEEKAMEAGCDTVHLSSSLTARTFYESVGYKEASNDNSNILMKKQLREG